MSITASTTAADDRLRRLESVTDAALAHIDIQSLLNRLLGHVRDALAVDTAAVLMLDPHSGQLVATAGAGIEEQIRHGTQIPFSPGLFADRIVAGKQPVIIDRVDHTSLTNPTLRRAGIRSVLGVPLLVGGTVLGVLHVGTLVPRRFTAEDVRLLQVVADRVALATGVRLVEMDQAAALQRSLLPAGLPALPGLEFAARYLPAGDGGGVGGDWYDVFALPSGWLGLVIGDVVGRGLRAAIAMGRLRSSLRAYAIECDTPSAVLDRLDRDIQHFEPDLTATVLYAMLEPSFGRLHLSTAGHLLPVRAVPGQPTGLVDVAIDPPLGVRGSRRRRTAAVAVSPGTVVLFFTDGLVERRTVPLDDGLERLRAAVVPGPAEAVCTTVLDRLIGADPPNDDVAVLALRRQP